MPVRRVCRVPSTCPRRWGTTPTTAAAEGEVGKVGVAIDSLADMRLLMADLPMDKVTTSMTINATGAILLLLYQLVAEEQGVAEREDPRHHSERHLEGVHRPRDLHLPAAPLHASHRRHVLLLRREPAQLEHHLHFGLPHPRGRIDGRAGDRVHAGQRDRLRRGGDRGGHGRGRVRAPALVLLERAQQPLRRGGQVPRRTAHVGPHHDGAVRRQGRPLQNVALPHPDRRARP